MRCRVMSSVGCKPVAEFESSNKKEARTMARKKGLSALVGAIPSVTVTFQLYNEMIRDWVSFGEIKGCL